MIVIDTNVLIQLITNKASADDSARLRALVERVSKEKSFIGIPTPTLAEFLVKTDDASDAMLRSMERTSSLRILPFDRKAAYQCALLDREARKRGSKRGGDTQQPYQKVKVDWQIVAIALSNGAELVVSGDAGVLSIARAAGLTALRIADLPLPAEARQQPLFSEYRAAASGLAEFEGELQATVSSRATPNAETSPTGAEEP